jgi:hypothetical protein
MIQEQTYPKAVRRARALYEFGGYFYKPHREKNVIRHIVERSLHSGLFSEIVGSVATQIKNRELTETEFRLLVLDSFRLSFSDLLFLVECMKEFNAPLENLLDYDRLLFAMNNLVRLREVKKAFGVKIESPKDFDRLLVVEKLSRD